MRLSLLLATLVLVAGCDTSAPETTDAVYVGNQGIFSDNGGTVTAYDPASGTAAADAVPNLGGLVQNVETVDGALWVLLNFSDSFSTGSGRIVRVNPATRAVEAAVEVGTPRDWARVGSTAFVSNLYDGTVTPVDLASATAGTPIAVGDSPEGVAAVGDRVYVGLYSEGFDFGAGRSVAVVNASERRLVGTVDVGCDGPRFLFADGDGEVWVVCTGRTLFDDNFEVVGETPGAVVVLDGASGAEVARFALEAQVGSGALGTDAAFSAGREELFVSLGQRLAIFDTAANRRAGTLDVGAPTVSAVAFDDTSERLYLGRLDAASPFAAPGTVTVHTRLGELLDTFAAGVIPTDVAFAPGQ